MRHRLFEKANIDRTAVPTWKQRKSKLFYDSKTREVLSRAICKARGLYRPVISIKSFTGYVAVATVSAPMNDRGTTPVNVMWSYCTQTK